MSVSTDHWSWDRGLRAALRKNLGLKRFRVRAREFRRERNRHRQRYVRWQGSAERWVSEGMDADDRRWRIVVRNKHYRFAYARGSR